MTRETKIGLVVASSFLCLVGVVVASKFNQSKTQADDAAAKAKDIKKDESPAPIPLVSAAPGPIDPKLIEKVGATIPVPDNKISFPSVPGIPTESPPAFPSAPVVKPDSFPPVSAPGFPPVADSKPSVPVPLPPVGEIKPPVPVSLPPVGEIKPPVESPSLPVASADDDKIKRAMDQLKNEGTKPRFEPNNTFAAADPPPSVPGTSTPPAPPVPVTPTPPPTLPSSPAAPVVPTTPPSIPPVTPTAPGSPPTLPSTPSLPPTPISPTTPPTASPPPTLPSTPLTSPGAPVTPPVTPSSPLAPSPSDFLPPVGNTKPPIETPPLVRPPMDPNLPNPLAKPTAPPPVDPLAPRPSTTPVISDLPSDKKPAFVGTLADPNKVAPIIPSQPDTRTTSGQKYLWQFQDSWDNVSNRYFQSPKYAKALAAFNQRPQPVPGDTILIPDANYLDQRFSQFVSNLGVGAVTPIAPPMGVTPIAPPMGVSPIAPPTGFGVATPSTPGVDLSAPRSLTGQAATGTTSYRVPTGGKYITEVARETLRSEFEWGRILELNRHLLLNPSQRIPEGTILTIPQPRS